MAVATVFLRVEVDTWHHGGAARRLDRTTRDEIQSFVGAGSLYLPAKSQLGIPGVQPGRSACSKLADGGCDETTDDVHAAHRFGAGGCRAGVFGRTGRRARSGDRRNQEAEGIC